MGGPALQTERREQRAVVRRSGQNLILVEDSRMFSSILRHRFRTELGLNVTCCTSLRDLQATLANDDHGFSLAVVNLNLPDSQDGDALEATISNKLPTIVFTASYDINVRNAILERGVIDYVVKDSAFAVDNLVTAVRRSVANSRVRVLVVDPVSVTREALADRLKMQQYTVMEVSTGAEALALLDELGEVELVLVDHKLPDMDGCELTRQISRRNRAERMQVMGMASVPDRLLAAAFMRAGASDFIARPFVAEELQCRISRIVETLTQFKQLRSAAALDYLTGLYNRRHFFDEGPRLVNDCLRSSTCSAVGILDIDHFKRLNDTYGHEIGDQVLKAVAGRLQSFFAGSHNLLSRIGGEEFAVLFTNLDSRAATSICDALREDLTGLKILADDEELSVTVSVGVAAIDGYESFENYLNAADQFLYMAKHKGRNQVYSDARMAAEAC
jgi:diguanylate cyclase (GGDEF)-like protein